MNPAAKIETLINIYDSGLLCKCCEYDIVHIEDTVKLELRHSTNCEGRVKLQEIMFSEKNNE